MARRQEEESEICFRAIISFAKVLSVGTPSWYRTMGILRVALRSRYLVWRHWCLRNWRIGEIFEVNSDRLRTFGNACLEIVMLVEAKFSL